MENNKIAKNGITIITLSFDRLKGLKILIDSIIKQNLKDLEIEYIIFNNSPKINLKTSAFSKIGRSLKKVKDLKIFNSNFNYYCQIRYQLATLAKYETIMFLDDDIELLDKNFIYDMFTALQKLGKNDILSCHCKLWTAFDNNRFSYVFMYYREPKIDEVTECDIAGPGISMFNKRITMNEKILNLTPPDFPEAYDMAFSLAANAEFGSRSYYFPCFGKINFSADKTRHALSMGKKFAKNIFAVHKQFFQNGYQPVLKRLPKDASIETSPELKAATTLESVEREWHTDSIYNPNTAQN